MQAFSVTTVHEQRNVSLRHCATYSAGYLAADAQAARKGALCSADEQQLLVEGSAIRHLQPGCMCQPADWLVMARLMLSRQADGWVTCREACPHTFGVRASMRTTKAVAVQDCSRHSSMQSAVLGPREFFLSGVV